MDNLPWSEKDIPETPTEAEIESARELKKLLLFYKKELQKWKKSPVFFKPFLALGEKYLRIEFRRLDKIQKKWKMKL